jgi:hypothetical protein
MRAVNSQTFQIRLQVAGYMRVRSVPRHMRRHDLRMAYLSPQQLRYRACYCAGISAHISVRAFNLPYQLGFSNLSGGAHNFETPADADTASIPVSACVCVCACVRVYVTCEQEGERERTSARLERADIRSSFREILS